MEHPMKQRTNGRAVQGAARESNGARKGLRVGKAAGCMYTADSESERYEYDKARYIVFRIHRERGARCHESGRTRRSRRIRFRTPPVLAIRESYSAWTRTWHGTWKTRCRRSPARPPAFRPRSVIRPARVSQVPSVNRRASISRALEYGKWIRMQQEQPTP